MLPGCKNLNHRKIEYNLMVVLQTDFHKIYHDKPQCHSESPEVRNKKLLSESMSGKIKSNLSEISHQTYNISAQIYSTCICNKWIEMSHSILILTIKGCII